MTQLLRLAHPAIRGVTGEVRLNFGTVDGWQDGRVAEGSQGPLCCSRELKFQMERMREELDCWIKRLDMGWVFLGSARWTEASLDEGLDLFGSSPFSDP